MVSLRTPIRQGQQLPRLLRQACIWLAALSVLPGALSASAADMLFRVAPPHGVGAALRGAVNGRAPGYLGIGFHDVSAEQSHALRLSTSRGVEVVMVDHDGPAGKAGLRPHDIILSLNGKAVAGAQALKQMLHEAGAGVEIALTVMRGGKAMEVKAQLANRDEVARAAMAKLAASEGGGPPPGLDTPNSALSVNFAERAASADVAPANAPIPPATPAPGSGFLGHIVHGSIYTGAVLETMEPQLAGFFGAPQGCGLLVHSVEPESPASAAGLRAGDVVVRADSWLLRNTADWTKRLHTAKGRPISLSVLRDRHELNLTLQQDPKHHSLLEFPRVRSED